MILAVFWGIAHADSRFGGSRRAALGKGSRGWLISSPELVIEVSSPSNRKLQRKAAIYLEHGAEQVWIVHSATKTVTVMTLETTTEFRLGETLEFHGAQVAVGSLFFSVKGH
jgi:Uma2 family endonuclease